MKFDLVRPNQGTLLDQNDEEKADGKSHDTSRHPLILLNDAVLQILNIKYNNDDVSDIHSGYIHGCIFFHKILIFPWEWFENPYLSLSVDSIYVPSQKLIFPK